MSKTEKNYNFMTKDGIGIEKELINPTNLQLIKAVADQANHLFKTTKAKNMAKYILNHNDWAVAMSKTMDWLRNQNRNQDDLVGKNISCTWCISLVNGKPMIANCLTSNVPLYDNGGQGERFMFVYEKNYDHYDAYTIYHDLIANDGLDCEWVNVPTLATI